MFRYLYGPVPGAFADNFLARQRQAGACLCFHPNPGADLQVGAQDTWDDLRARLPAGWEPDAVVLALDYTAVPAALWTAPLPVVGLAPDWDLLWHHYRRQLRRCDLVLTDPVGAALLNKQGLAHVEAADLTGCSRVFAGEPLAADERDIDILFVGNLNPWVQRHRLPWLGRLARLAQRRRVVIQTGVSDAEYLALSRRARIVFNRSRVGVCNRRASEAALAGALLFQEEENREAARLFTGGHECVFYRDDNFEALLDHYLDHEDERRALARAGRARAAGMTHEAQWAVVAERLEGQLPALRERAERRPQPDAAEELHRRGQEALVCPGAVDPLLPPQLEEAVRRQPGAVALRHLLGLVKARYVSRDDPALVTAESAAYHFQRAVDADPGNIAARLNLCEALEAAGQRPAAVEQARHALHALARLTEPRPDQLDGFHFPLGFSLFRVEWERAAWAHAGDPAAEARAKLSLLRYRLHAALADWTGDAVHAYEAYLARPDLPAARAALGAALQRGGHPHEATLHLIPALANSPFDRVSARALFAALGQLGDADGQARLARARERFSRMAPRVVPVEAWFAPASAPAGPTVPAAPRVQPRVSLTMIVKNEEKNLPACLTTVRDLFDEVIVVDTGSKDRTREEAARFNVQVHEFPWVDSFAAARNEALRHATGEWVLWLDADDRLDEPNRARMRDVFANLGDEKDARVMKVRSAMDQTRTSIRVLDQVRLFPRHPQVYWKYRVHEQILWGVRQIGGGVRWTDVLVDHVGYQDPKLRDVKLARNLRLLELDEIDLPDDSFTLFNLGWTTLDLNKPAEALPRLTKSLAAATPDSSILRKLYALIIRTQRHLGERAEAVKSCREGRARFPEDPELLFEEAILKNDDRDVAGAADSLVRLLEIKPGRYFASVDPSLRGFKTRSLLGELYREMGRTADAERQWRLAVEENPAFTPAWVGLGNLYCRSERWADLERVLAHVQTHDPDSIDVPVLQARRQLARRDFAGARGLADAAIRRAPRAVGPRLLLSHVLLQEGDLAAAEPALRAVLALDPNHAEASRNLDQLLARKSRAPEGAPA
jgi:glycosyltransferase involved in cell wall biosynthesis